MYDWGGIASADETTFITQAVGLVDRPNLQAVGRLGAVSRQLDPAVAFPELWT